MKSVQLHQLFVLIGVTYLLSLPLFALPQDDIHLVFTPADITAPTIFGIGGTKRVTIQVSNQSKFPIEMAEKRWMVVERQDRPDLPVFTPMAPYSPLIVNPGDKLTVTWRLRESTYVYLTTPEPAKVAAGKHKVFVYYRLSGEEAWRRHTVTIDLQKISWIWIFLGVLGAIILLIIVLILRD